MKNLLISLFDHSGNISRPYRENGWEVWQVDIKNGIDILTWDYKKLFGPLFGDHKGNVRVGIIAAIPCTAYALSGNRHKKTEARKEVFKYSQLLCSKTEEIIEYFKSIGVLIFWQVENPSSDIHTHNPWLGKVKQKFNPCDFAGFDPIPDNSRYNKQTWLWGEFNQMELRRMEPFSKENPGWKNLGGKSERTKELRSITPLGFSYAFYHFNH